MRIPMSPHIYINGAVETVSLLIMRQLMRGPDYCDLDIFGWMEESSPVKR